MTDLQAEVERLKAENEALKALRSKPSTLTFKVSDKGALSVYGMGRFPVTLYREQWEKLLSMSDELRKFILDNQQYLVIKAGVREAMPTTLAPPAPVDSVPPTPTAWPEVVTSHIEIDDTVPF